MSVKLAFFFQLFFFLSIIVSYHPLHTLPLQTATMQNDDKLRQVIDTMHELKNFPALRITIYDKHRFHTSGLDGAEQIMCLRCEQRKQDFMHFPFD